VKSTGVFVLLTTNARGVFPIAPTPFFDDGRIDTASIDRLIDFYLGCGATGVTVLGQLGEAPKLSHDESVAIATQVIRGAGELPIVVGVSAPGFAAMRALTHDVMARGAAGVMIANPIYREVIPTMLAYVTRASLPQMAPVWLKLDGALNPTKLLDAFLTFWRQHGQPLLKSVHYHEIAPHIVLMAFLHRVVNGGGSLEREYAIGTRRMDVCLRYGQVTLGMELKVWRDGESDPLKEGLAQLDHYLDGLGLATGWLVIFDQRSGLPEISERTTTETATTPSGRNVTVIRG